MRTYVSQWDWWVQTNTSSIGLGFSHKLTTALNDWLFPTNWSQIPQKSKTSVAISHQFVILLTERRGQAGAVGRHPWDSESPVYTNRPLIPAESNNRASALGPLTLTLKVPFWGTNKHHRKRQKLHVRPISMSKMTHAWLTSFIFQTTFTSPHRPLVVNNMHGPQERKIVDASGFI